MTSQLQGYFSESMWDVEVRDSEPLSRAAPPRERVLLALFDDNRPTEGLRAAAEISRALGAELHVLRVFPRLMHSNTIFPHRNMLDALSVAEQLLKAERATRSWLRRTLDSEGAVKRFLIAQGNFLGRVAAYAAELDARLIVVAGEGSSGAAVASLACASTVPVLVARGQARAHTIVAATDLTHSDYPVLRQAADMSRRIEAQVVALHNLAPLCVAGLKTSTDEIAPSKPARAAVETRLMSASQAASLDAKAVVTSEVDAVDAILYEARARDADLVVVGVRTRSWLEFALSDGTAEQVVNRTHSSVLVTPLDKSRSSSRLQLPV